MQPWTMKDQGGTQQYTLTVQTIHLFPLVPKSVNLVPAILP